MNIDTVGRIRPPLPGEVQSALNITEGKRVHAPQGGNSHSFQILYQPDATNQELFSKTVQPLLDLFIAGFNTCVLVYGESASGKSFTTVGEQSGTQPGIIPQVISYVASTIQQLNSQLPENSFTSDGAKTSPRLDEKARLLMYHFEIYSEIIKDLMASRGSLSGSTGVGPMELHHSPERGLRVKNLQCQVCRNPAEAVTAFWQSWTTRTTTTNDFGPASDFASYIFQLELFMMTDENPLPNLSTFTVVRLPGAEKLAEDLSRTRVREGPTLSKSIVSFNKLTADIARQPEAERVINYSDSKLTALLEDILGGNCKTRMICCLPPMYNRPEVMSAVLTGCGLLSQVKNYPIINDCLAQNLVTQYRTRVANTLNVGGLDVSGAGAGLMSRPDLQDQLLKFTSDNTQLRERNDRLFQRLEEIQNKISDISKSKSELSSKLVSSEEEKLKVSKGLVELQLENNRLVEEYESENFELKNKILTLENQLVEFELEKNNFSRSHDLSAEHARQMEENRKQIADEFIALKKKAISQEKDLEAQIKKNNEMREELARMIESEAALLDLRDNVERRKMIHEDATKELERAREVLRSTNTHNEKKTLDSLETLKARRLQLQREALDDTLLGDTSRGGQNQVMSKMWKTCGAETRKLELRLKELKAQLSAAYAGIRTSNQKCAEQAASMIVMKEMKENTAQENSKLQLEIKEINEEYRQRLWKYVQDIADFVDNGLPSERREKSVKIDHSSKPMQRYVDEMLKEMKSAFRSRENQLSKAARNYKKQSKKTTQKHEKLLIHYRIQRDQLSEIQSIREEDDIHSMPPVDIGPEPSELIVTDNDLVSDNTLELNKLRSILDRTKADLRATKYEIKNKAQLEKSILPNQYQGNSNYAQTSLTRSADVNVHMRDLHLNTQLERERAQLLTRATVAEQQLKEQQEYIDTHLTRYKQEIVRLRRLLSDKGVRIDQSDLDISPRRKLGRTAPFGM